MNPRLVSIAGCHQGAAFPVGDEPVSIGRDETNSIPLSDLSASRRHCSISKTEWGVVVTDLDSLNGTFLNGIPVRERILEHNDRIEVGESVFVFLLYDETSAPESAREVDLVARPTLRLRLEDAMYLAPEKLLTSIPLTSRIARGLDAILRLSREVQSARSMDALEQQLLKSALRVVPAERGSMVLVDENFSMSREIVRQAARGQVALLSNDIRTDAGAPASGSLIAAPMILRDTTLGVFCLETSDSGVRFDEDHLQLASAIATIGAMALENLRHLESLEQVHQDFVDQMRLQHAMVGEAAAMREVYSLISKVAQTDSTILISGESGTGKELAARAIHLNSARSARPLVVINCATLSEPLLESELFGHEKGAFTGAVAQKRGKLEVAEGGTVFLDEVGDIPGPVQAKILRALQEREFERIGSTRSIKVDTRWIAATNKDLLAAVRRGEFREDLYYRLNVVQLRMPALRERRKDIALLASFFVAKFGGKLGRKVTGITPEAKQLLADYDWPGNVRELENTIERAVVIGAGNMILPEDLPEAIQESQSQSGTRYLELLRETKKRLLREALDKAKGNQSEAARILGLHPSNLSRMMKNLKVTN